NAGCLRRTGRRDGAAKRPHGRASSELRVVPRWSGPMLRIIGLTLVGGGESSGRRKTRRKLAHAMGLGAGVAGTIWLAATVSGHEDRQTLVAANSSKAYGIGTFRVTQRDGGFWPEEG